MLEPNNYYEGTQTAIIQIILKHSESSNFIKLDSDGIPLASQIEIYDVLGSSQESTKWECVLDNKTGLTWEIKTRDGGLRDRDKVYRWGGTSAMGRNDAKKEGSYYNDWNSLIQAANIENTTGLCGFNDWRVPLKEELQSIDDIRLFSPTLNTDFFPNAITEKYWTASPNLYSSPYANKSDSSYYAWYVEFYFGFISYTTRTIENRVRLVRGQQRE